MIFADVIKTGAVALYSPSMYPRTVKENDYREIYNWHLLKQQLLRNLTFLVGVRERSQGILALS